MRDRKKAQALAHELVSKMTIEERASQLKFDAPPIERLGVPAYNWWNEALHGDDVSAARCHGEYV